MSEVQELETAADSSGRTSRLISASAMMAAGTALSRLLGFGRLMLLVLLFGNGTRQAEMFTLANTVPNSMYILLAGGVLNTVLVPQIVRSIRTDADAGEAYTNRIMTAGLIALAALTTALTLAVPWVIALYSAPGWKSPAVAGQYDSMVRLAYYCMPQIFFYGVHVLAGQVLNARDRFGPMMWAPIANNVVSIAVLLIFWQVLGQTDPSEPFTRGEELLLGLGSTLGIAVQAAVLIPYLRSAGYRFRPRFDFRHTGLGHTFSLAKWTLGFVLVTQAALVVINRQATAATVGGAGAGLATYNNAHAVWILPHSLITVSLATAMLPAASRLAHAGDLDGVRDEMLRTMRLACAVLLPTAVAFMALGVPIARLAFGFGRGARDADLVGWTLMALAVGLVPFTLQYICLRTFYALEDTRSTFFLQLIISAANVGLALAMVRLLRSPLLVATGLGIAYSAAYVLGLALSFAWLKTKLPGLRGTAVGRLSVRLLAAAAPAGLVAFWIWFAVESFSATQGARLLGLVLAGIVGLGTFLVASRVLHITEIGEILATLRRPGRRTVASETDGPDSGDSTAPAGPAPSNIGPAPLAATTPDRNADSMLTQAGPSTTGEPSEETASTPATAAVALPAGTVLGSRYRMEELLAESRPAVTWRAFDLVLSRSVLVHLLPPGDDAAPALLAAARQASVATDSRFLRVLDAVHSDDTEIGSYIVCEYATGQSLELILAQGPLSGLEAAWVVREVADALAGVHALRLYHERISPATVIITPTGNVKIVGLLIEAALRRSGDAPGAGQTWPGVVGADTPEHTDVCDLGRLLYAALVSRWPGGPAYSLADAPAVARHWMTPRQVRAGVSPALDTVCDRILGDPPRHRATPITTAAGVVSALTKVLGSADAAGDLERRLRQPIPRVRHTSGALPVAPLLDSPPVGRTTIGAGASAGNVSGGAASGGGAPSTGPANETGATTESLQQTVVRAPVGAGTGTGAAAAAGSGARAGAAGTAHSSRRWIAILVLLALLLIAAGVASVLAITNRQGAAPQTPSQTSAAPGPADPAGPGETATLAIRDARDFDPQGDDQTENPDEVARAYDGDPRSRWRTLRYRNNPELGGLKRGVGLVFDLGSAQEVRTVKVSLSGNRTDLEARVPRGDAATRSTPPMASDKRWRVVAEEARAGKSAELTLAEPVTTRYLLVYLTSLPKEGSGYRGGIYEVQVLG
jgi:putative peptidoglycan lipid II flippase